MSPLPVVLVEGSDASLVADAAARAVDEALGGAERSLALEEHGDEVDLAAVAEGCATPPFLGDRRVVVVRDVGRFGDEELAPILDYLKDPLPTTSLVLVAGGGRTSAKLAAAARKAGGVVSADVQRGGQQAWLRQRIGESGLKLDAEAEAALAAHLGEDVGRAVPVLAVLEAVYGAGARIGRADVEPYLGEAGSVTPWELTDSIDAGNVARALVLLHRLLEGGARHPLVVLAILHRHVSSLLRVDDPSIRGEADAARALGIPSGRSTFPARKALAAARRMGSDGIAEAVGLVADAELDLKGASAWPAPAVLEVLVARLCRLARARPPARRA
jgi:DNA polymerase-3 subunit delta